MTYLVINAADAESVNDYENCAQKNQTYCTTNLAEDKFIVSYVVAPAWVASITPAATLTYDECITYIIDTAGWLDITTKAIPVSVALAFDQASYNSEIGTIDLTATPPFGAILGTVNIAVTVDGIAQTISCTGPDEVNFNGTRTMIILAEDKNMMVAISSTTPVFSGTYTMP